MNDIELEARLRDWLSAEAGAVAAPPALQRRVLDIPSTAPGRQPWWTARFSILAAPIAVAAVAIGAVVGSSAFHVFDRPAGADGGLCSNRQVHDALDALRSAPGYRYDVRDELFDFDPAAEFSFDEPQFAWRTALSATGAYRAPDRAHEVVLEIDGTDRGYLEHLQIGDTTWRRPSGATDVETWLRMRNPLPTANLVDGWIRGAFPAFEIPGVTSLDWGGTPAPDAVPGEAGCTVATRIPGDGIGDVVALRISVASGLPLGVYRGPPADAEPRHGAVRHLFLMSWTTPAEAEFVPPPGAIDAPPDPGGGPPPTQPPARTPAPDAWQPADLPLPEGWTSASVSSAARLSDGGVVAVGTADRLGETVESTALVWRSIDGVAWELAAEFPDADLLTTVAVGEPGLVAVGGRMAADGAVDWMLWTSTDGSSWTLIEELGSDVEPGLPTWTQHGWVVPVRLLTPSADAGGGVQIAPALLRSPDGGAWERIELPGTGSGSLSSVIELPDGSLLAVGCESPGGTNSTQFGELCLTRPWRSADGLSWEAGSVLEIALHRVVVVGDELLAVGSRGEAGMAGTSRVYRSTDGGDSWTEDPHRFAAEMAEPERAGGPESIALVAGDVVVEGVAPGGSPSGTPYPALWRRDAGGEWVEIPIGFGAHGGSIADIVELDGRILLVGSVRRAPAWAAPVVWIEP